ncbi:hypothetical protein CI109_100877 [Kwoniella shandongensis]|uniref:Uncharacterized protein n=1 Tax=Kwoniella shandongensis TaxID=1734106 RepID=A0A5M6BS07_9TREE|nr:uncharacterized protein CI109_006130 [Kwoniella shandongensis]KAA5525557.1 hypothetical protein CI109_006130 [Kwoniella shandongensis]
MSRPPSTFPSSAPTPVPSSPPPSESYLSELDGTAPSIIDTSFNESTWDGGRVDPAGLNLVSWKLDVNARAEDGVDKRGFNAISTVLNHPTKKADPLRSTRKPLPPLTQPPPVLPKPPPPTHYDAYLKNITPLYDSFISSQQQASSSTSSAAALQSPLLSEFDRRPTLTVGGAKAGLPPLDSVPSIFFEKEFNLSNPSTWAELVGSSSSSNLDPDPSVQDDLSTHLDTLERHLIHEIGLRSTSFFSALSNLQDLHSESTSCLSRISDLQSSLKEVGQKQARKGLEVIDAQEKLRVLKVTERAVRSVGDLDEILRVAKRLVDEGDWSGGLGYLEDVVKWWEKYALTSNTAKVEDGKPTENGESSTSTSTALSGPSLPSLPLSTLPALSNLPTILTELTSTIATQLESALSAFLLSVLSLPESSVFDKDRFRSALEPMLEGLVRCGKTDGVEAVWREVVTISIRDGSRKHLPVGQTEDEADNDNRPQEARGANLAQALQSMDHSAFLLLSTQMYSTLLARIRLSQQVGEEIQQVFARVSILPPLSISNFIPDPAVPATTSSSTPPDFSDVITSGCELAHTRASKILAVRSEQHASLPLGEFVEIFKENWEFIVTTEGLAKKMIISLRGVTSQQARAFLVSYHAVRLTKSAKLVEEEQWTQVDVSPSTQHVVDLLVESAVADPAECSIPPPTITNGNGNGTADAGAASKTLSVEDKTYFVVKATAESLVLLGDYLKIVINLELVVTDVMSRIIEFLKSFNSRTCQVVLGAGAMRSAGLKNITAKHLALASQSLSVIVALIPYIREFVRRHLSPKQAVMLTEFDKLKRDYQEHQNEIHAKLVAIMSDRLAVHCGSLREIDWEATPEKDGPRAYAEMLVKETATLHKVLSKYLASSTVEGVMSEVISAIVSRLSDEYGKVEFKSDEAKKRMLQDVALISIRLRPISISESGKSISTLETLVKEKSTPRKPIGQTVSGLLRRNNSTQSKAENGAQQEEVKDEEEGDGDEDEDGAGLTEEPVSQEVEKKEEVKEDSATTEGANAAEVENNIGSVPKPESPMKAEEGENVSSEPAESEMKEAGESVPDPNGEEKPILPEKDVPEPPSKDVPSESTEVAEDEVKQGGDKGDSAPSPPSKKE